MKVTECCGATDRDAGYGDGPSYGDIGLCPDCKDHAEFVEVCDECSENEADCVCPPFVVPVTTGMVVNLAIGLASAFAFAALFAACWLMDNSELAFGGAK